MQYNIYNTNTDNKEKSIDEIMLISVVMLIFIGIITIYSASIAYANNLDNHLYYLVKHIAHLCFAIVCGIIAFCIPISLWYRYAYLIIALSIFTLLLVLIPHIGQSINGSKRWIGLGFTNFQPSEFIKIALVIYLAKIFANSHDLTKSNNHVNHHSNISKHNNNQLLKQVNKITQISQFNQIKLFNKININNKYKASILVLLFIEILLLLEPDMGSATVVFIIAISLAYLAGINYKIILSVLLIGSIAFLSLVLITPYRMKRIVGFIDPWQDALGNGYQLTHSLLAFGHGSWFGNGLGNSIEKLFYLPEAHTDFIIAIIGEEFGFIGICVILVLFCIVFYRGFTDSIKKIQMFNSKSGLTQDKDNIMVYSEKKVFEIYLSFGLSLYIFVQMLINIGVNLGILPTKGLTLPFISFGGSSIVSSLIAVGILLKLSRQNKLNHTLKQAQ